MILAVDPGLGTCGWAVMRPRTGRVLDLGVITSEPDRDTDEWTDRTRRTSVQSHLLANIVEQYECTIVAAEAISLGGPPKARQRMAASLCLSWGSLVGLAEGMGLELYEVPPKLWQHAILPKVKRISYTELFARLESFVGAQQVGQLKAITPSLRNHALDAVGVGIYAALSTAVRIDVPQHVETRSEA